ncbi:MAG: ABC transporter permease [Dehalococcoidia bacterium]|nr:ABC transporter permease [Dehalococcoidia bacterium]
MIDSTAARSSYSDRVLALGRRDLKIELSYHFGQLIRLLSIVFPVATFFYIGQLADGSPELAGYGGSYFEFVLVGLTGTTLAALGAEMFSSMISREQSEGTLASLLSTPTPLWVLLAGATLFPLGFTAVEVLIYMALGVGVFGAEFSAVGILVAIPIAVLTVAVFAGIGILSAAFIVVTKRGEPITPLIRAATTLFAGAVFPITLLPDGLQLVGRMLPSYYAIEGLRGALLSDDPLSTWDEMLTLAVMAAVLLPLSMWALKKALRWGRVSGTLSSF